MRSEPKINDLENPLVSVLVYNYYGEALEKCLKSVLEQDVIKNLEVIYIDNVSEDGAWDIALAFAKKYSGCISLKRYRRSGSITHQRNRKKGDPGNLNLCVDMATGKYIVTLCENDLFLPEYLYNCIQVMESDPFACFEMIEPRLENNLDRPNILDQPLVSVLIHNYNYGRYLRQCFDSVISQTYKNIEVVFSDNASTDDSWDIAVEYSRKYPGTMTLMRNRKNFGPNINLENCYRNINGKYFCVLCSDDALEPEFVTQCVSALEKNPDSGFAITHRTIIDEEGVVSQEPSFYNQSCVIPGAEQAAVYMMAAVNPSISQLMYNYKKAVSKLPMENILTRWFAQRILDFNLCCEFDVVYIKDPLLLNRVHSKSDSQGISGSMVEIFGQYILPHQFVEIALTKNNMTKAIDRLPQALEKLSHLCVRYSINALINKDERNALRYFHLAMAILPEISSEPVYQIIEKYWNGDASEKTKIVEGLKSTDNLTTRNISYDPPPGSVPIDETSEVASISASGA